MDASGMLFFFGSLRTPLFLSLAWPFAGCSPQWFYGFDLLWIDGRELRDLPQIARKAELRRAVPADGAHLRYVDHVENSGIELFQAVCEMDLEGIVAKHKQAPYGMEKSWLKIKNPTYSQAEGRLELFEARVGKKPAVSEVRPGLTDRAARSPRRTG